MDLKQFFLKNVAQTSDFPLALQFEKAEGVFLYDAIGKPYIDFISGIAVSNVGHRHPKVTEAIKNQVDKYLHQMVYGEYLQSPQIKLATAICQTLENFRTNDNQILDNVYFTNSGTEAVEGAMKLAKRYTNKPNFVVCNQAYHGSTHGALSLGDEHFKRNFRPLLPGIKKITRNDFNTLEVIDKNTAAVIIEPIGGESGVVESSIEFLKSISEKCKEFGALLIFDEIQSGFGRTGAFWAFENYGICPDILLTAKGMGGGMPIGAFIAPSKIMGVLKDNPILGHISTFGGHPVSCAASLATLEIVTHEINFKEVVAKGNYIKANLTHPKIKEIRGKGLMMAAQMENFEILKSTIDKAIDLGVITDWFLYCDNAMRIAPPLNISYEEIDLAIFKIKEALA